MKKNLDLILLFVTGLVISIIAAVVQSTPGYMDASYSYAGGLQLVNGKGFTEPFIWNYLDMPSTIEHPAHTYWMPLPSLVAAAGMFITGEKTYLAARALFILLAACIPVLSALLAQGWSESRWKRIFAGCLAIFPSFYLIFSTATETFTLYMFLGALFFLTGRSISTNPQTKGVGFIVRNGSLGIIAGLMHLTRADGILWVVGGLVFTLWISLKNYRNVDQKRGASWIYSPAIVLIGYLACMSPWYLRNLSLYGWFFSPGGSYTIWLTNYDQTYIYPATLLGMEKWLQAGWTAHFKTWGSSLATNIGTFIGVQGCVMLFPLFLIGGYRYRKQPTVILGAIMWLMIFGVMTFVFPFAGARGGFFHSGAGLQVLFWSMVPVGLESVLGLGVRWRGWKMESAMPFFSIGIIVLCACVSGAIFYARVIGEDPNHPKWQMQVEEYTAVEQALQQHSVDLEMPVMVNDPPGYFVASGRQSVVVPYGDVSTVLVVAERYEITYLLLEANHPEGLNELFTTPEDVPGLQYLGTVSDTQIYRFCNQIPCVEGDYW